MCLLKGNKSTHKYEFIKTADIRLLDTAKHKGGKLTPELEEERLYWVKKEEGINKLKSTVSSLGKMTAQILDYPQIVWGGSFILFRNNKNKLNSKITENFYPLSGN